MVTRRRLVVALVLVSLALLAMPASTILPLIADDYRLDGVVVAVALDWRDFGQEVAQERLQYELDHQSIGSQVGDQDCAFSLDGDGLRLVRCAWEVEVILPGLSRPLPLAFASSAGVDSNGVLVR